MKFTAAALALTLASANAMTPDEVWDEAKAEDSALPDVKIPAEQYLTDDQPFSYWTDMAQVGLKTYVPFFSANMQPGEGEYGVATSAHPEGGVRSPSPGENTFSYVALPEIKRRIAAIPQMQEDRTAKRGNELGLLRLNTAFYPECMPSDGPDGKYSRGEDFQYCGIALGVPRDDHKIVRPILDEIFGDGTTDGDIGTSGNNWDRKSLADSARRYLAGKKSLDVKIDAGRWTTIVLHKVALDLDLSEAEAADFVDFQAKAVTLTPLPSFVPNYLGSLLKKEETLNKKAAYLVQYENAIERILTNDPTRWPELAALTGAARSDAVMKVAWGLLDALIFAGGLSVPGVIHGSLAAHYTGIVNDVAGVKTDITTEAGAALIIMETIRTSPPVLGVPYVELGAGEGGADLRHAPLAGMGGYDRIVYGADADDFRIRMSIADYHANVIDWADSGKPVDGKPWTSRICPAKSMSYSMALGWMDAMDANNWYVDPETEITRENGPLWWSAFTVHKSCDTGLGQHVGLYEASRSYAVNNGLQSCNWFDWCGDGYSCDRKWYQYSGHCKVSDGLKFHGESCGSTSDCDHDLTQAAGVDLTCNSGKCGFMDGKTCSGDSTNFMANSAPPSGAGTGGAWTVSVLGGGSVAGALGFMFYKPKRELKHAPMKDGNEMI